MGMEGAALPLWLRFPYAQKPYYAAAGMPQGYRYFATMPIRGNLGPLSTRGRKVRIIWQAQRITFPFGGSALFDHNMQGLPPPN